MSVILCYDRYHYSIFLSCQTIFWMEIDQPYQASRALIGAEDVDVNASSNRYVIEWLPDINTAAEEARTDEYSM